MSVNQKYHQAVNFLESIMNLPIKDYLLDLEDRSFYIDRLYYLLKLLGNPQNSLKFIHVTGTSGKGSTINYLHEILNQAGFKIGSYFSPHPTTAIERIKINDKYISPNEFTKLVNLIKPYFDKLILKSPFGKTSYFETFLALAFLYFKQQKCDYVILEAGLGGTHDATNVIKNTKLAIITNINYDHAEILGKSLTKIATNKAGIIKKGSTLITAESRPKLLKIFENKCYKIEAKYLFVKVDQVNANQTLAWVAAKKLNIDDKFIDAGLKKAKLPCRFETIQTSPKVIIDGAHNPAKLAYLANKIKELKYKKLYLVLGMSENKDIKNSLKMIVPLADSLYLTRFLMSHRKTADLKKLYTEAKNINPKLPTSLYTDPTQALKNALKLAKSDDLVVVTGSFFLSGELRQNWISEEYILKHRISFKK